ncbi:DUF3833 domain-containing protein [Dasania marina]|uniref:DUF3833 domain-containing protein n=1 Tax=Dasania marina TaxID=471499 RepID=UPI00037E1BF1|nr:DUF3833 domain-containing protein [Dasania marina]
MTALKIYTLAVFTTLLLTGCAADINYYKSKSPQFDIKEYFNGEMTAWGMVQDYSSKVTRRFCVELNGQWNGNQGVLAETFYFNDGEVAYRNWQLTRLEKGRYQGEAEDVVGIAKGLHQGFAFQWQYQLIVTIDGENYQFTMDDWMYQLDQNRVFNRTSMSKLGVTVAEISLFFDKNNNEKCL